MIFEIAMAASALISSGALGTALGLTLSKKEKKDDKPKVAEDPAAKRALKELEQFLDPVKPTVKFLIDHDRTNRKREGFRCPKCDTLNVLEEAPSFLSLLDRIDGTPLPKIKHPTICTCGDYAKEHYHFHCGVCQLDTVMRTADDR